MVFLMVSLCDSHSGNAVLLLNARSQLAQSRRCVINNQDSN